MEQTYEPVLRSRVFAIDPISRGFGYVVLEGEPLQLVDWGLRICSRKNASGCADVVRRMRARHRPTVVVLEDWSQARALRAASLKAFQDAIADVLAEDEMHLRTYSRRAVRFTFAPTGAALKDDIVKILVAKFPELRPRMPRKRKIWESEDSRTSIFDALALAVTHLATGDG